ncbi:SCO6745 family protein [Nonomuraea sp. LPB2021202275-12-8]|uniref:SCO6745 family protein n=1 Tax=Nonomuraea sp. LPB2021202275-12-8 TaxID=3120159 RepID=UPI00300CAF69
MKAARTAWRRLEPLHGMIYFVPEGARRYAELGLRGRAGYFASRGAAFGRAPAELVIATFYNFHPGLVRRSLSGVWDAVSPEEVLAARYAAADEALRRAGVHELDGLAEVVELARRAAEAACEHPQGRPLFAAHAALPWPEERVLQLWHAQTLLREFRGDGHVACLLGEGIGGLEALVLHAASGTVPTVFLKMSRAWPEEEWDAAEQDLRERGLLDGDTLSTDGKALRQRIEDRTDTLALPAYAALGEAGCERLAELAVPFRRAVVDAGLLQPG